MGASCLSPPQTLDAALVRWAGLLPSAGALGCAPCSSHLGDFLATPQGTGDAGHRVRLPPKAVTQGPPGPARQRAECRRAPSEAFGREQRAVASGLAGVEGGHPSRAQPPAACLPSLQDPTLKLRLVQSVCMVCQAVRGSAPPGGFHFAQKAELVAQMMVGAVPAHGGRGGRPPPPGTGLRSWPAARPDGRPPQRKAGASAKG